MSWVGWIHSALSHPKSVKCTPILQTHIHPGFQAVSSLQFSRLKSVGTSQFFLACCICCLSYPSWFYGANNIWRKTKIVTFLLMRFIFIILSTSYLLETNTFRKTLFSKILSLQNGREVTAPVTTHSPAYRVDILCDSCVSCYRHTAQLVGDVTTLSGFVCAHTTSMW